MDAENEEGMTGNLSAGQPCEGCLSRGRQTSRLPSSLHRIFSTLLFDIGQIHKSNSDNLLNTTLCWECIAVLKRTAQLVQRATWANEWLMWASQDNIITESGASMSSLQYSEIFRCTVNPEKITSDEIKDVESLPLYAFYEAEPYETDSKESFLDFGHVEVKQIMKIEEESLHEPITFKNMNKNNCEPSEKNKTENTLKLKKRKNRLPGQMFEKVILTKQELHVLREESTKNKYFASAPHKCDTCLTGFRSMNIYQRHISKYHSVKNGKHICTICNRRVYKKTELTKHVQEHHVSYKCRICGQKFLDWQTSYRHYNKLHETRQMKYNRHAQVGEMYETIVLTETDVRSLRDGDREQLWFRRAPYKCDSCIKGFNSESQFQYHQTKCHSMTAGELVCSICLTRFQNKTILKKHLEGHFRSYRCNVCGASFTLRLTAYRHYNNVHKLGKSYKCLFCAVTFDKRFERKDHIKKVHTTFPCPKCEKEFKYEKVLQQHIESHKPRLCVQCGREYGSRKALRAHRQAAHVPGDASGPVDAYCVECDKSFDSRKAYSHHITVKHTYADRVFPCSDCEKTFRRKLVLKNHYNMVHLKKKNFQCDQCDKYFVNRGVLNHHKAFVHERRPRPKKHVCDICTRAFSGKSILDNHRRTHTGERPFVCHSCSAAFTQKVALDYHVRRIHLRGCKDSGAVDKPLASTILSRN